MSQFQDPERVEEVRHDLANTWLDVLEELKLEVMATKRSKSKTLSEAFCKKLKICSDQLRIEFRADDQPKEGEIPETDGDQDPVQDKDPLKGLSIVSAEDAA